MHQGCFGGPDPDVGGLSKAMLSIGKLAKGQARYYLAQAKGRVDRSTGVSTGVEDYYLDGGEAEGEWLGTGAMTLGQDGRVGDEELRRVLSSRAPATGDVLPRRELKVPGFDVTFSAPKSVSALFGIGDEQLQSAIREAHDVAVRDAFGFLERHASVARRGHAGSESVAGAGLVAAAFRHRTSRAGDPQLHTHVLVANLTNCDDGVWRALDGRRLYVHGRTAGFLYEARLRAELSRRLGVSWTQPRNGISDVEGVSSAVRRAFSRRRAEIEAELERRGESSASAAEVAALATRRAKAHEVTPESLRPEWRRRAAGLGLDADAIVRDVLRQQHGAATLGEATVAALGSWLAGADGVTRDRSALSRDDMIRAWCEAIPSGADVSSEEIEMLTDELLDSPAFVPLREHAGRRALRCRHGGRLPSGQREHRWSTPSLLAAEQRILATATADDAGPVGHDDDVDAALANRPSLSDEQRAMVRRLVVERRAVAVVVGKAGSGKTFALDAAREAWERGGLNVVGAAVSRRAARELEEGSGILSTSVAALLGDLRRRPEQLLSSTTVLVIDEASLVGTRDLDQLIEHVTSSRAKLVLVGDDRQLPAIQAGGAFKALRMRANAIVLDENRGQVDGWERRALDELREGDARAAIARYARHGRLTVAEDAEQVRRVLVQDWWEDGSDDDAVMIAFRRSDVRDLNDRARGLLAEAGRLGVDEITVGDARFAVGDRVVLRKNNRRLAVANGERAVIARVDVNSGELEVQAAGRVVKLDSDYLQGDERRPALQHGYAVTGHVAQGMTVDRAYVLGSDGLSREWGYVAMSRGRRWNGFYAVAGAPRERDEYAPREPAPLPLDEVLRALGRSRAELAAHDVTDGLDIGVAGEEELSLLVNDAHALRVAGLAREMWRIAEHHRTTPHLGPVSPRRRWRRRVQPAIESTLTASRAGMSDGRRESLVAELRASDLRPLVRRELAVEELARRGRLRRGARVLEPTPAMMQRIGPRPERPVELRQWAGVAGRLGDPGERGYDRELG